jgi:hypothetical protein
VREWDVSAPSAVYPVAEQAIDFPAGGEAVINIAQLGPDGEPGAWASLGATIPAP